MAQATDVAIIGAGPYGLSLAAHLRCAGRKISHFRRGHAFWRDMPDWRESEIPGICDQHLRAKARSLVPAVVSETIRNGTSRMTYT